MRRCLGGRFLGGFRARVNQTKRDFFALESEKSSLLSEKWQPKTRASRLLNYCSCSLLWDFPLTGAGRLDMQACLAQPCFCFFFPSLAFFASGLPSISRSR